jgi:HD-GYP domain-containing protein (c-di-GMP phosphodiesterase class II)
MLHEPRLVRHCIAVAVQLLDLSSTRTMPTDVRKALVACALVHDLGKALLPESLLDSPTLQDQDRTELAGHVVLLQPRLASCQWLSKSMIETLIERLNERLDGSGYPRGLAADALGALTRLAMIVDAVDAMRRDRADRAAWPVAEVYRYLLGHPEQFDQGWVKRYIKHFGLYPIGALVRFESGRLGWVQRLDDRGRPSQVQLTDAVEPPDDSLGEVLSGNRAASLGRPLEEIPVST